MARYDTKMVSFVCKCSQQKSRNEDSTLGIVLYECCTVPYPVHTTKCLNILVGGSNNLESSAWDNPHRR